MLDVRCTLEEQADWLLQQDPDYLLTHPSIVKGLAQQFIGSSKKLSRLKQVRTFGEVVSEEVRSGCRLAWNVPVTDAYSAAESGYLALQCPEYEHYHVQSEGVLIEILNDDGKPSQPGEIGRLLLTTLTNYAMPLIRYEIGDYAEVGEQCACGRGLPVLKRILGRERNICVLPNGQHRWPSLGTESFEARIADFPPIQQFQLVQRTSHAMELFLVMHRKLSVDEDTMVQGWVREAVGYPFDVTIRYVDSVSRNSGNKFEDFRCEMAKLEPARCTNP
jgi:phenylacetate-CoA ligase